MRTIITHRAAVAVVVVDNGQVKNMD
jgi:hypothetical protein